MSTNRVFSDDLFPAEITTLTARLKWLRDDPELLAQLPQDPRTPYAHPAVPEYAANGAILPPLGPPLPADRSVCPQCFLEIVKANRADADCNLCQGTGAVCPRCRGFKLMRNPSPRIITPIVCESCCDVLLDKHGNVALTDTKGPKYVYRSGKRDSAIDTYRSALDRAIASNEDWSDVPF